MLRAGDVLFASGRSGFLDHLPSGRETTSKVYVKISPADLGRVVLAQLDTGAAWSILEAEIADAVGAFEVAGLDQTIHTRVGEIPGKLVRLGLTLVADEGDSLAIESTVFVSENWPLHSFLGYAGFLERIRFALDPSSNQFYFGACG